MELLTRYDEQVYLDAARSYTNYSISRKDYYFRSGSEGTQLCNAIVEYAIYNRFPDWTVEDAIEKMTPELFFDLGLTPLLRGNDARHKLFVPPFLLNSGAVAFAGDPVRSKARYSPINMKFVMQWVFGRDPEWKDVVSFYYSYLNGMRKHSSRPNAIRCNQYFFENWWFDGNAYTKHDCKENSYLAMDLLLHDLEREGEISPGLVYDDFMYLSELYQYFAFHGNDALRSHGLGTYWKLYRDDGAKAYKKREGQRDVFPGDALDYLHKYLLSRGLGNDTLYCENRLELKRRAIPSALAEGSSVT